MIGVLSLMSQDEAQIFQHRARAVGEDAQRRVAGVEVLMPSENRNRQRVALFDFERLVVDDAAAAAGEYVIDLIVKMAVRPRAFAGRKPRDASRERLGVEAGALATVVAEIPPGKR